MAQSRYTVPATDLGEVVWRNSRRSNSTGKCVQLAEFDGGRRVAVRDSKDPRPGPAALSHDADLLVHRVTPPQRWGRWVAAWSGLLGTGAPGAQTGPTVRAILPRVPACPAPSTSAPFYRSCSSPPVPAAATGVRLLKPLYVEDVSGRETDSWRTTGLGRSTHF
jgi:hypothetical protein